jgi:hypothetical protein
VSVASCSSDVELQQRAYELQALLTAPREVRAVRVDASSCLCLCVYVCGEL